MKFNTRLLLPLIASMALLGACASNDIESAAEDTGEAIEETADDLGNDGFWDKAEGNWDQFSGSAKEQWGELTDDEVTEAAGNREQLVGKIQEKYGIAKNAAEDQVDEWVAAFD